MPDPCSSALLDTRFRARGTGQGRRSASPAGSANSVLVATASLALVLGMLVYMSDRPAAHALLMPTVFTVASGPLFGMLGQWLPSFVHPFAFSLYSAAARAPAPRPAYGACVVWWAVNLVFEGAQHPHLRPIVVESLRDTFGGWTQPLSNYLLRGTFDPGDLIAAALGALAAAMVLLGVQRWESYRAH